jgi:hypothetical protein
MLLLQRKLASDYKTELFWNGCQVRISYLHNNMLFANKSARAHTHTHTHTQCTFPTNKSYKYFCLLTLFVAEVVKHKRYAGMKLLIATTRYSAYNCHARLDQYFLILLSQQISYYELLLFSVLPSGRWVPENSGPVQFSVEHFRDPVCFFVCVQISYSKSTRDISECLSPMAYFYRCIWTHRMFFSYRNKEKEPWQRPEAPLVHCGETYSDVTVRFITFDGLYKLNRSLSRP